jgi:type I restriction enzyme S subunit
MPNPIGRACLSPVLSSPYIVAVDITIFSVDDKRADHNFLIYALNNENNLKQVEKYISGTTRQRISRKNLEILTIALPQLDEQKKIASILSKVDELIQKTDQVIEQTQRLKKGLMQRLLTKGIGHTRFKEINLQFWFQRFSIPQEWRTVELNEIVKLQTGYPFKSEKFSESGIKLLKGSNVIVQKIDWNDVDYYPTSEKENFGDYLLREGDIVIAMDRPFVSDGFKLARISKKDLPCLLVQRIGRFLKGPDVDYEYLHYFFRILSS